MSDRVGASPCSVQCPRIDSGGTEVQRQGATFNAVTVSGGSSRTRTQVYIQAAPALPASVLPGSPAQEVPLSPSSAWTPGLYLPGFGVYSWALSMVPLVT